MKVNGYHHIGLHVADMEKSLAFYRDGFGGKIVHEFNMGDTGKKIYLIDLGGNAVIELIPRGTEKLPDSPKWEHVALNVDDARAAYDLAISLGAESKSAPADANLGGLSVTLAFAYGPDKEVLEFFQVKS